MDIRFEEPVEAQKLDDEGDPVGKLTMLEPGDYRLVSAPRHHEGDPEGTARAWVEGRSGALYEARGLRMAS